MISMSRYINIVSGVGGGAGVAQRQLILRLMTQNALLPPGIVMQAANASVVGSYFGVNSEEFIRSEAYFGFVSKNITSPSLISFARWVSTAIAPMIVGDQVTKSIAALAAVTAGTLTINDGGTAIHIAALAFTGDATLTAVAATLQTALRASADSQLTTCTVTFNTNTQQFTLTGSTTGAGNLTVTPTLLTTDVSALLGWGTSGTVYVPGQAADPPTSAILKSAGISNNFGSFCYCTPSTPLTNTDIENIAAWNDSQNNLYLYSVATSIANAAALFGLIGGLSGVCINILSTTQPNDYVEQSPCEVLAATNYSANNSTQNYMYQQFPARNITVSSDTDANTCDSARSNYIGQTQQAGTSVAFYQRGILCGGAQDATDINTYCNEMALKSTISATLLSLFLSVGRVPANADGAATVRGVMLPIITQFKNNGTISAGKEINAIQQAFITGQAGGDTTAWRQVQTIGYWLFISFSSAVNQLTTLTEWTCNYLLIYSKDDAIRSVDGSDIMI